MIENSKELLLKYIEEVCNKGRVDLIEKYAHPDYFAHGLGTDCFIEGHEGWWQLWKKMDNPIHLLDVYLRNLVGLHIGSSRHSTVRSEHTNIGPTESPQCRYLGAQHSGV